MDLKPGRMTVVANTGEDFGKNAEAWEGWLAHQRYNLQPQPWFEPTEPQQAWESQVSTKKINMRSITF